jgi:predicted dehydrogenase
MIKVALVGAGKMGISHLAILGANPRVEVVGVCDSSKIILDALHRYGHFPCFTDFNKMLQQAQPDAVVVAVPTKYHATMVHDVLKSGMHVFVEKPFCLHVKEEIELVAMAKQLKLVNQVGYHNKFLGTFKEVKKILDANGIGEVYHFHGQSYGPVVLQSKQGSWRSKTTEGGGCLMDYASHVIDLINYLIAPITTVDSSRLQKIFSVDVEDAVYAMVALENGVSGMLSVNWSDETYRKMSTSVTIIGKNGKIIVDANECKIFFKGKDVPEGYSKGWNTRYVTDLTPSVQFYLRGEEYTSQLDYFLDCIETNTVTKVNSFSSAAQTDNAIFLIREKQ